jgi:hypothetical protein
MTRVCLFVGPSVSAEELRAACATLEADVDVLPPVQQGDLLRLSHRPPDVIGIVDGFFFQVPSVLHKEILLAMQGGTRVLGAASLGALRAAELDVFGMEGIGEIYRMYRRGRIDGDDEVAVLHTDAADGFRALSEPMVNMRHNLRRAVRLGILDPATARGMLARAKALHFSQRSYAAVFSSGGHARLSEFLTHEAIDLKREDALLLLRTLADRLRGTQRWPSVAARAVNQTIYLHLFQRQYVRRAEVSDALAVSIHKFYVGGVPRLVRRLHRRALAIEAAFERGLTLDDPEPLIARFRRRRQLESDPIFEAWLSDRCLNRADLAVHLQQRDLLQRLLVLRPCALRDAQLVRDPLWMRPGIPWDPLLVRELKVRGELGPAIERARYVVQVAHSVAERLPGFAGSLDPQRLERFALQHWRAPDSDLESELHARGFTSYAEFLEVARLAYVHQHLGGGD